ncbi:MAG: hypothetical protein IKF68_05345, partial [Erysipelotrichaceae bacterium]|nr:hypothetical protein [Erysipelotrichaceae bacterium]
LGTFGMGEYVGSVTKTFKIKPVVLSSKNTTVEGLDDVYPYGGSVEPDTYLFYGDVELIEGEDYTVSFKNNNKAGTATIIYTGIGNYSGTVKKTFKIDPVPLATVITEDVPEQPYQKGGNKPDVELYDPYNDAELVLNRDYTLSYKNNTKLGTATVTIKGKGNYTGTLSKEFSIVTSDIGELNITAADKVFANKKNNFKTKVTVTDTNGKKLAAGTDYDKNVKYYVNGNEVEANAILPVGTEVTVVVTAKGNNYTGEASTTFRIVPASIASAKIKIAKQEYTGKPVTLDKEDITIKVKKTVLGAEDYEIVSYSNNVNKGTAKVTLQGVGNYGGTKTVNFKIGQRSFIDAIWELFNW